MIFRKKKPAMTLGRWMLIFAAAAAALLAAAGPGARFGVWDFRLGFQMIQWSFFAALAVAGLTLVFLFIKRFRYTSGGSLTAALILAVGSASIPYMFYQKASSLPRIHDITTDTQNVPEFVEIAALRTEATNPVAYPGDEVAQKQRAAYPQIDSLRVEASAGEVFEQALIVARQLDWSIVAQSPDTGRIEAFDTTFWFGFVDDVVIRIRQAENETVVDVRSKSRVGVSDVGKNAARIEQFLAALAQRLDR